MDIFDCKVTKKISLLQEKRDIFVKKYVEGLTLLPKEEVRR